MIMAYKVDVKWDIRDNCLTIDAGDKNAMIIVDEVESSLLKFCHILF